ncbi:MAG: hypothetical protein P1S46_04740 [bacterium]|nr:hypothetical protein [bacterium]MDT8395326.1 hypothetical protein [bacterium]
MEVFLRRVSLLFSAGVLGGLVNSIALWAMGRFGITAMMGVNLAPAFTPVWLYPRMIWGGIWAALFLIPVLKHSPFKRGVLYSLAPSAVQLFVLFPHMAYKGYLGLELGGLTPFLVVVLNAVWGIAAAYWLSMLGED